MVNYAERLYHAIVDLTTQIIPETTSNKELEELGKAFLGKKFKGVYSSDNAPKKPGYYIVNLDPSHMPGSHWVALFRNNRGAYVYDSFGRKGILPFKATYTESDPEQLTISTNCGARSLAWLILVDNWGIKKGLKI